MKEFQEVFKELLKNNSPIVNIWPHLFIILCLCMCVKITEPLKVIVDTMSLDF